MGKKIEIRKKRLSSFLIYPAIVIMWSLGGCATQPTPTSEIAADNTRASMMEQNSIAQKNEMPEYQTEQLAAKIPEDMQKEESEKAQFTESEPRILFEPTRSNMNQVLGIDFTMLDLGKSRLTVTTDKKVTYDLDRKGDKDLVLRLHNTTIPSLLLREINTTNFQTALDKVKPAFSTENKEVSIAMSLREITPFHIKQTENGLSIDFDQTSIKPPDKKIIPLDLAEAQTSTLAAKQASVKTTTGTTPANTGQKKAYTGEKMHLEFINADITYVLQLIYEVSKKNIIWDPEIKGKTVSMTLKDVPWEQALDLILDSNDLARSDRGDNIIWITTKAKMDKFLADEKDEAKRRQQEQKDAEEERKMAEQEVKEQEPLITEYLPVDFAKAEDIEPIIVLSKKEGAKKSIDKRTNTIVIKDTASNIEEAKKTVAQFDTPVKQIMIEARIVDASENFSRDLGLKWDSTSGAEHTNLNGDGGEMTIGGNFSTNAPNTEWGNIGINFARLTSSGLGTLALDATLALAESEGTAKVISAPKVIASNNEKATISRGTTFYPPPSENVQPQPIEGELRLTVTPNVSPNDYVTMDINVEDRTATTTSKSGKTIETKLVVKSGETFVIGGIFTESTRDNSTGFPVLKDIPLLGWLFKAKNKQTEKTELLIFITPTVLPPLTNN
jgi:type IV pilus assembly protein PilQ